MELQILFRDPHLIAINKPPGLLVHKTHLAGNEDSFVLQILRDQIGQWVYPVHRLDRKTSGVLLLALDTDTSRILQRSFAEYQINKKYLAIVRGWTPEKLTIDYPLKNEQGKSQEAITAFRTLQQAEIPVPAGKHNTSRYSLIEVSPKTGRFHQIRKHLAHIYHPVLGDRPHGCNKQNRLWKERFGLMEMMLHASSLTFPHPYESREIFIEAAPFPSFNRVRKVLFEDLVE